MSSAYRAAENLTDRLAALRMLVHYDLDGAEATLAEFHAPLSATIRWCSTNGFRCRRPRRAMRRSTVCEALSQHPSFSFKNPNRVYALIRSFAAFNPVGFNRPDGEGYRFVGGVISDLDKQNPSVAARIATAFRSWRMLEPQRRGLAEESAPRSCSSRSPCRATLATS